MTTSEALKMVTECGLNIEEPEHEEVMVQIKSALEKQILTKPIAQGVQSGIPYICPSCGKGVAVTDCCHHCGQALDWSEEND